MGAVCATVFSGASWVSGVRVRARAGLIGVGALAAAVMISCPGLASASTRPGLAVGTSDHGHAHWRLAGRRVTVRLAAPLGVGRRRVVVLVQCGDDEGSPGEDTNPLGNGGPSWAALAQRRQRVASSTRVLRLTLSRDVAGRVNLCLVVRTDYGSGDGAVMTVIRGRTPGCQRGPHEHIVFDPGPVRVTSVASNANNELTDFRACLTSTGARYPIDQAGGRADQSTEVGPFASAGSWLAWADVSSYLDTYSAAIRVVNLAMPRPRVALFDAAASGQSFGPSGPPAVPDLVVGSTGTVLWVLDFNTLPYPQPPNPVAQLYARRFGGASVVLDSAPVTAFSDLAVSSDGLTVTWTSAGSTRSSRLG